MPKSVASKSPARTKRPAKKPLTRATTVRYLPELPTDLQRSFWDRVQAFLVKNDAPATRAKRAINDYRRELGPSAVFAFHKGPQFTANALTRRLTAKKPA